MILVAGGTGNLGARLVQRLLARGEQVRVLTRDASRVSLESSERLEVVEGDVREPAGLARAMWGVETVVSAVQGLVGSGGVTPSAVDRDGNVHLIEAAEAARASFVLISVVGATATSPMELARMKHAAELRLRASSVAWTIVRATAFLETWTALLEETAKSSGRPLVFGRGDNPINFVSINDVAAFVERIVIDPSTRGQVLEIGGPQNFSLNQLAAEVQKAADRSQAPRHVPRAVLHALSVALRPVRPDLARQARAALVMDTANFVFDAANLRQRAGPQVTGVMRGG